MRRGTICTQNPGIARKGGALPLARINLEDLSTMHRTAVKSNALAELMNRASKIHWKNLT